MAGDRGVTLFVLLLSCWCHTEPQPINMTSGTVTGGWLLGGWETHVSLGLSQAPPHLPSFPSISGRE